MRTIITALFLFFAAPVLAQEETQKSQGAPKTWCFDLASIHTALVNNNLRPLLRSKTTKDGVPHDAIFYISSKLVVLVTVSPDGNACILASMNSVEINEDTFRLMLKFIKV